MKVIVSRKISRLSAALLVAVAAVQLQGCFVVGAAAVGGTAMVASDRRTSGAQLEDKSIELKAGARISDLMHGNGTATVNSYNGQVLLTGQVPLADNRAQIEANVQSLPNVRAVINEISVGPNLSSGSQAHDLYLNSRVRAALIDTKGIYSQAYKLTTCDSVVYMQGIVTQDEGDKAAAVASSVPGVKKVVTLFEVISEQRLQSIYRDQSKSQITPAQPQATTGQP